MAKSWVLLLAFGLGVVSPSARGDVAVHRFKTSRVLVDKLNVDVVVSEDQLVLKDKEGELIATVGLEENSTLKDFPLLAMQTREGLRVSGRELSLRWKDAKQPIRLWVVDDLQKQTVSPRMAADITKQLKVLRQTQSMEVHAIARLQRLVKALARKAGATLDPQGKPDFGKLEHKHIQETLVATKMQVAGLEAAVDAVRGGSKEKLEQELEEKRLLVGNLAKRLEASQKAWNEKGQIREELQYAVMEVDAGLARLQKLSRKVAQLSYAFTLTPEVAKALLNDETEQ